MQINQVIMFSPFPENSIHILHMEWRRVSLFRAPSPEMSHYEDTDDY